VAHMEALRFGADLASYEWADRYSTSRDDLIDDFYKPAMERACSYDRAVGYFRSSFLSLAWGSDSKLRFAWRSHPFALLTGVNSGRCNSY
jgi:hypothetical protein